MATTGKGKPAAQPAESGGRRKRKVYGGSRNKDAQPKKPRTRNARKKQKAKETPPANLIPPLGPVGSYATAKNPTKVTTTTTAIIAAGTAAANASVPVMPLHPDFVARMNEEYARQQAEKRREEQKKKAKVPSKIRYATPIASLSWDALAKAKAKPVPRRGYPALSFQDLAKAKTTYGVGAGATKGDLIKRIQLYDKKAVNDKDFMPTTDMMLAIITYYEWD